MTGRLEDGQFRVLPLITALTEPFWTGGARDEPLVFRCHQCGLWLHPPRPLCRRCGSTDVGPERVSGTATVVTYTVNRQSWKGAPSAPYVIAVVELPEQEGLRLTTNIVDAPVDAIAIGMPVRVSFEPYGDVWLPLFVPTTGTPGS